MKHKTTAILLIGDILILVLFAGIGRISHQMAVDLPSVLVVAFPFAVAWLAVGAALGLYRPAAVESVGRAAQTTALTALIAVPLGVLLRSLLLGRMMALSFWIVSFISIFVLMIPWRLVYAWYRKKTA